MKINTYNRLLVSLLTEFKHQAQPHIRSLWADLLELEEATGERALSAAREQSLRRIRVLEWAAHAANAGEVQAISQTLEHMVATVPTARDGSRPELFEALHETMTKLTESLCWIEMTATTGEQACRQPGEALVESCTD
jgi:hypothetical protein